MSAITHSDGSVSVTATEYYLVSASTSQTPQTNYCRMQAIVDFSPLLAGDSFQFTIYERVNGGTQGILYQAVINGTQAQLIMFPEVTVGDNWEVSLKKLAGTNRTLSWSVRQVNADNASAVNVASFTANAITSAAINAAAITAAKFATDAIDANALKADAVTEIQANLATSANQTLILAAVSNIAVTGAALNATTASQTVTTGTDSGGVANTTQADGTYDSVADTAGTLEFYYEFDISTTSGAVGVGVDWLGYVVGLVNTVKVFARNWGGSSWEQIGSIVGIAGTVNMSQAWELTSAHTSAGLVRIRFQATGLTTASVKTDRILLGYTVVPPTAAAIQSGLATAAAVAAVQADTDDIQTRLPAALTAGGKIKASTDEWNATAVATPTTAGVPRVDVKAMEANVVTATAINAAAITSAKFATDAVDANALKADAVAEIQSGLALAATALSTAVWTPTRAVYLDNLAGGAIALATALATAQTAITAIKAKTDNLPSDPGDASDIAAAFATISATLATIAGYIDTEVAAIKAKTDNLPADPAGLAGLASAHGAGSWLSGAGSSAADVVAALNEDEHRTGRTFLGLRRRLDALVSGQIRGANGPTGTLYAPDGTTIEAQGLVNPAAGTRETCDVTASETP